MYVCLCVALCTIAERALIEGSVGITTFIEKKREKVLPFSFSVLRADRHGEKRPPSRD